MATSVSYLAQALARHEQDFLPLVENHSGQTSQETATSPNPDAGRITIHGSVIAPDGKPVPGARVVVVSKPQPRPEARVLREPEHSDVLGSATADANGRFRIELPQVAGQRDGLTLFVGAKGWALTGKTLGDDIPSSDLMITIQPEGIIRGRIIDLQGQPISGVSLRVSRYHSLPFDKTDQAPSWPDPAKTDEQGRFTIPGLDPNTTIQLETSNDRHAPQSFKIEPRDAAKTGETTLTLAPAQLIEVRTTSAADGKPLSGVWVNVFANQGGRLSELSTGARSDARGLARIIPSTGEFFVITANPPVHEPYLDEQTFLQWPKGTTKQSVEVKLTRGLHVHGTVTEEGSGKPVAGAFVAYIQTMLNNPLFQRRRGQGSDSVTGPDGKFQIVVSAGPGHLLVRAATPDYLHVDAQSRVLGLLGPFNWLMYPDALARIDLKAGAAPVEVNLRLRRGVTVAGKVTGPDGAPVANAIVLGRTYRPYRMDSSPLTLINGNATRHPFMGYNGNPPKINVRAGQFEIPGCDPETPFTFYFFDRQHQLGATVELSGKSAQNGLVTVQLQKCGSATVRFKDAQGKPAAGSAVDALILVVSPGTDSPGAETNVADIAVQMSLDPERSKGLRSDADGRVTYVSLIPGATYRLRDRDFKAEAGNTIELPDLTLRPRR